MRSKFAVLIVTALVSAVATAEAATLDLARYRLTNTFALPAFEAREASAVTYNWDNGNLFVVGDEGGEPSHHIVQVTPAGVVVNTMALTGFGDTEGLTYIGGGKLVITEERLQDAYLMTYTPGGSVARAGLPALSIGADIGNTGIEGISFEQASGKYFAVKEKSPQAVHELALDFVTPSITVNSLFAPNLGVDDLSDIQVLSSVASLAGTTAAAHLLIYSQESQKLLEVTRAGAVVSEFSFAGLSDSAEGVTIDPHGTIYLVAEGSALFGDTPTAFVLTPVPEPETYAMLLAGLGVVAWWRRRAAPVRHPGKSQGVGA